MQILGQVLKNFPGTLSGDQKERITRAIFGVGRRTLGFIHNYMRQYHDDTATTIVEGLRREHPDILPGDLLTAARATVHWHMFLVANSIINRIASEVESPLLDPVFQRILREDPATAVKLVSIAISLHRAGAFPETDVRRLHDELRGHTLALRILCNLVITHFHLFDVKREVKQSICALLGIEYRPLLPGAKTRMLPPKSGERH